MFQIDNDTSSQNMPAPTAAGHPGFFVDGDPAKGLAATILPAEFMNMLMMEFVNLVKMAGLTPSKADYTQLSQALPILIARLATVDWSKVTNIPTDLVHLNTTPEFGGIELYNNTPYIDFHYGNDAADFNTRIINSADGMLAFGNKSTTMMSMGPAFISSNLQHFMTRGLIIWSQGSGGSLFFQNNVGTKLDYCVQHDDSTFNLLSFNDAGQPTAALALVRSSAQLFFATRPVWAGLTPWDTGNFNPASKANVATTLGGYGITDGVTLSSFNSAVSSLSTSINGANASIAATNSNLTANTNALNASIANTNNNLASANAAIATKQTNLGFTPVRQGTGNNQLSNTIALGYDGQGVRVQVDATDFGRLLNETNYAGYFPAGMASIGVYGIGSYGLFCYAPGGAVNPGVAVSGSTLHPSPTSGYTGYASPPGTWVCCGYSIGSGNTNSTTLFQRIS